MNDGTTDHAGAIAAARTEARQWSEIAAHWSGFSEPEQWGDVPPCERDVVGLFDPADDLARRAGGWDYRFSGHDLADVARFAAGLAGVEADAWRDDQPHIATRAFSDRRFLIGDRLLHWAVPWLDTTGRCHPDQRKQAHADRDVILAIADFHRPAPQLSDGREGMYVPGHDAIGPVEPPVPLVEWVNSLWSGAIVMRASMESMTRSNRAAPGVTEADLADVEMREYLALLYAVTAARWRNLAESHPGSGALWSDLAARAVSTFHLLSP